MDTPQLSHLCTKDYDCVYEPSEDSFLFLDALESDLKVLRALNPCVCLEVGSGSGVIITALACSLQTATRYLAIDINPTACEITKRTSIHNSADVEAINMDLVSCLRDKSIDLLVFNPPYVPTESKEVNEPGIARSWAGGLDGREVVDRLFADIPRILTDKGLFYLVVLAENKPDEIEMRMEELGYKMARVKERKIRGEHLLIMRFQKVV